MTRGGGLGGWGREGDAGVCEGRGLGGWGRWGVATCTVSGTSELGLGVGGNWGLVGPEVLGALGGCHLQGLWDQ